MSKFMRCPGVERALEATPPLYPCPECGVDVELWSDEQQVRCGSCNAMVMPPERRIATAGSPGRLAELVERARRLGASGAGLVSARRITVDDSLAALCRSPQCPNYGLSASCPPHVPGPDAFRKWQQSVAHALVVKIDVAAADLVADEKHEIMRALHELVSALEQAANRMGWSRSRAFAGGSCKQIFCRQHDRCRVVDADGRCRNPRVARPSMSGIGIHVPRLLELAGWRAPMQTRQQEGQKEAMSWVAGLILIG